jgi:hypothetical protein
MRCPGVCWARGDDKDILIPLSTCMFFVLIDVKYLQVYPPGYEDHQFPMVLVVWKYFTMGNGEQSVTIIGI